MTQTISESLVQPLQLGGPIDHPADADALLQGLVIPPINQEHSKSYVLQAAMNRVQLHRQEAALARDRYQRSLQFVHKSKLDYQRREDTLNQALAAYAYFEHMLPTSAESPSLLAMNTPPSHEMKQAQPPFIYYTSSGVLDYIRKLPEPRPAPPAGSSSSHVAPGFTVAVNNTGAGPEHTPAI